jgi:hypothetical protein
MAQLKVENAAVVAQIKLPTSLGSRADVFRLMREINTLNDFFAGAAARSAGTPQAPPRTTRMLDQLAELNAINLLDGPQRKKLLESLETLIQQAPNLHISFAIEPLPREVEPILVWLRENIDPHCLLQVGVQPSIAAGCVLRTPNRMFDMSLRIHLQKQAHLLAQMISGAMANGK